MSENKIKGTWGVFLPQRAVPQRRCPKHRNVVVGEYLLVGFDVRLGMELELWVAQRIPLY